MVFDHLVDLYVSHTQAFLNRSHKKQKDSLETWAVFLIFSVELQIYGVAVKRIHQDSEKW